MERTNMNGRLFLRSLIIAVVCTVFIGSASFVVYGQQQEQQQPEQPYSVDIVKVGEFGERLEGVEFTVYKKTSDGEWTQIRKGSTNENGYLNISEPDDQDGEPNYFAENDVLRIVESKPLPGYVAFTEEGTVKELMNLQGQHVEEQQPESEQQSAEDPDDVVLEDTGVVPQEEQVYEVRYLQKIVRNKFERKNFLIHKVDQDGKPLEGAEFEVYGKGKIIDLMPPKWK